MTSKASRFRISSITAILTTLALWACQKDEGYSSSTSPAKGASQGFTPLVSRSGTIIKLDPMSCQEYLMRHPGLRDGLDAEAVSYIRSITATHSGPPETIDYGSPEYAEPIRAIINTDPLGSVIADRFGPPESWGRPLLSSYVGYVTGSDRQVAACEDALDVAMRATAETSNVIVETDRTGASVKYVPRMFAGSEKPNQFTSLTTPSQQAGVTIGRYCMWTTRNGEATSEQDRCFWIVERSSGPFKIVEKR